MPGEPSVALALHAKDRGVRLVMISGSPGKIAFAVNRADQLLRKPFRLDALARTVQHALASDTFGQRNEDPD